MRRRPVQGGTKGEHVHHADSRLRMVMECYGRHACGFRQQDDDGWTRRHAIQDCFDDRNRERARGERGGRGGGLALKRLA